MKKFYKHSEGERLSREIFESPTNEYRATPFWAWNCKPDESELRRQIRAFKEMGFGGFHIHSRNGMAMKYLGEEFMHMVSASVDEGKKNDMLIYLYDEDRYSSGQAGSYAVKDPRNKRRLAIISSERKESEDKETAFEGGGRYFVAAYDVALDENGYMTSYRRIGEDDKAKNEKFYVYCETEGNTAWCNNSCSIDALSKNAMDDFIRITYDAYKETCGDEYGKNIFTMFTDEPHVCHFTPFKFAGKGRAIAGWTYNFEKAYFDYCGEDILESLPELFFDASDHKPSLTRYRYFDLTAELFTSAFLDNCAERCERDGLLFTGHVMGESSVDASVPCVGDVMRNYRRMHIPGIDMLCNHVELETAVQCRSAVRQYAKEGMLSEMYGITNYDFDFRGHKFQTDWQMAMGVTLRVPHLSFVSMEGEAKRDYPATISIHAPWYKEYRMIEDHFARVGAVMSRGKAVGSVAVIHPVESYWLALGADDTSASERRRFEYDDAGEDLYGSSRLTRMLISNQIDFDYICESTLPELLGDIDDRITVGDMKYHTVIVHNNVTLRKTTVDALTKLCERGGRVIFVGEMPKYEDLKHSAALERLKTLGEYIELTSYALSSALADTREVTVRKSAFPYGRKNNVDDSIDENIICGLREEGDTRYLFAASIDRGYLEGKTTAKNRTFEIKGGYRPTLLDSMTGEEKTIDYEIKDGMTRFTLPFYENTSALVRLERSDELVHEPVATAPTDRAVKRTLGFIHGVEYSLDAPNVYLLDVARYSVDGGEWQSECDVLAADIAAREAAGLEARTCAQPWCMPAEIVTHFVDLEFTVNSEIDVTGACLALEHPERCNIALDGEPIGTAPVGYFVDKAIKTVPLPKICKGEHTLTLRVPLGSRTYTEPCYLLGMFGVRVSGAEKVITELPKRMHFGDYTTMGLPFYAHNLTYKLPIELESDADIVVRANRFSAQVLGVSLDGEKVGNIAFAPYEFELKGVRKGGHTIELTAFGSMVNTFGTVHYVGTDPLLWPGKWYLGGDDHSDEYALKKAGILSSPVIEIREASVD